LVVFGHDPCLLRKRLDGAYHYNDNTGLCKAHLT
jgi:hypothetical protein